jgi:hypothetical protein
MLFIPVTQLRRFQWFPMDRGVSEPGKNSGLSLPELSDTGAYKLHTGLMIARNLSLKSQGFL